MDCLATKVAFKLLHQMGVEENFRDLLPMMCTLFTMVLWLGPFIGLPCPIYGMKQTLYTGFWAFGIDSKGSIYPNLEICTPFWVCLYTIHQYRIMFFKVTIPLKGSHNFKRYSLQICIQLGIFDQTPDWLVQLCGVVYPWSSPVQLSIAGMFWLLRLFPSWCFVWLWNQLGENSTYVLFGTRICHHSLKSTKSSDNRVPSKKQWCILGPLFKQIDFEVGKIESSDYIVMHTKFLDSHQQAWKIGRQHKDNIKVIRTAWMSLLTSHLRTVTVRVGIKMAGSKTQIHILIWKHSCPLV